MKFFLPVQDPKIAEESYQNIKKTIETQTGWPISDTRYYEIHYRHGGQDLCAQVGGADPLNGEIVFAIFKPKNPSSPFLLCTYSRGVMQNPPILTSHDAQAIQFD
ncbi:MAG: hypothetical protein WA697_14505 [Pseudolabrys sp.]